MAISLETINVGVENQATGSDSLYTAFTKAKNNFATLANTASPYNTFSSGNGIITESFQSNGVVTITNSGVLNIISGTGITASSSNGNVILSVSGYANGTLVAGVTNVGIQSSTLTVSNSPVISNGIMTVNLPSMSEITPGFYVAPSIMVDQYGRITSLSNTASAGTVTSVAISAGEGIGVEGGPILSDGIITVTNTGVTRLNAGPGILLSGHTGELTVSSTNPDPGTVSSVEILSSTLLVSGGPITSTGTITIEMPETDTMTGTFTAGNLVSTGNITSTGNSAVGGNLTVSGSSSTTGNLSVTGNASITGNVTSSGRLVVSTGANVTGNLYVTGNVSSSGTFTSSGNANIAANLAVSGSANISGAFGVTGIANITGNITAGNISAGNLVSANYFTGTLTTQAQPNITSVGTLVSANVSGNLTAGNVVANTYLRAIGGLLLDSNNGKYVALSAQDNVSANYAWGWPLVDGSNGAFLSTNGSGTMSFKQPVSSSAPATATSAGIAGQIAYDADHVYVCVSTNTWKRATLSTW